MRLLALAFALLFGCGGTVIGTGGQGGSGGSGGWQPCAGQACGANCTPCDPEDPSCALPGTSFFCDASGTCGPAPVLCSGCATDADCVFGLEWCVDGACGPCDDSGKLCDILCEDGWSTYTRNGCSPCACAPTNDCTNDSECGQDAWCYAGEFCWDWCPPGEPGCCYGNICSYAGCPDPVPVGCLVAGCPPGGYCETGLDCKPSSCTCTDTGWSCTNDCAGGVCVIPL
jgi:hypothetical protein